jgi:hypothetical protein
MLVNRRQDEEQRAQVLQRLDAIETEIRNLANAIATGAPAAPLSEAIAMARHLGEAQIGAQ